MSDQLYAVIGRKQAELEAMHAEYYNLLALLQQVVSGEVEKERVVTDLNKRTWTLEPGLSVVPVSG